MPLWDPMQLLHCKNISKKSDKARATSGHYNFLSILTSKGDSYAVTLFIAAAENNFGPESFFA